jgi:hypothetical protein
VRPEHLEAIGREVHLWTARDDRIESLREFASGEEARTAAAAT